jgi:hypothetical protein
MRAQKRFCHFAGAYESLSPPHPWPGNLENSEPELPANVGTLQERVPMQSLRPFRTVLGQQ